MVSLNSVVIFTTLLWIEALARDRKPSSVDGCYSGWEGSFFWKISGFYYLTSVYCYNSFLLFGAFSKNEFFSISGDNIILNITSCLNDDEWVSLGISDDALMGQDDVVALYKDSVYQSFIAVSLLNPQSCLLYTSPSPRD